MTHHVVPVSGGVAPLGDWGTVELRGATSAVLRLSWAEDVELPEEVALDITAGVVLLNDELGRLLFLPYAGDLVVAYDLKLGESMYPAIRIPRQPDPGLRMASVRLLPGRGVVYLTENTLACFGEDGILAWREDEDFAGWIIEGSALDELYMLAGDWAGNEQRQTRSLADGHRLP